MKHTYLFLTALLPILNAEAQNVGIGTNTPVQRLHIVGGHQLIENSLNTTSILSLVSGTGNGISIEANSTGTVTTGRIRPFQGGGATAGLTINQNSFMGVGVMTAPQYPLHIHTSNAFTTSGIAFTHNSLGENPDQGMKVGLQYDAGNALNRYGFISVPANLPFNIWQGTQRRLVMNNAGNVGIGMEPYPGATFSVNGSAYVFAKPATGALILVADTIASNTNLGTGVVLTKHLSTGRNFFNFLLRGDRSQAVLDVNFKNGTANEKQAEILFDSSGRIGIGNYLSYYNNPIQSDLHLFGSQTIEGKTGGSQLSINGPASNYSSGSYFKLAYNAAGNETAPVPLAQRFHYFMKLNDSSVFNSPDASGSLAIGRYRSTPLGALFYKNDLIALSQNKSGQVGIGGYPLSTDNVHEVFMWGNTRFGADKITLDRAGSSSATSASIELRNDGAYRYGFGYDVSNDRFFLYEGKSNSNALFINNGRMGIGNRNPTTNTLEVNGNASKATAGDWLANSDARLKKNITPFNNALEKLQQLKGVMYEWNDDKTGTDRPAGKQMGFTAQNIQQVFPQLVSTDAQGYLQTSYGTYDALYVEAIKALLQRIETLEQQVKTLQHR